jgi:L-lactate dehydrogenase (cytochrome)
MSRVSVADYRKAAKRKLPRFLFDYLEGGSFAEHTISKNLSDLADVVLKQRVLKNIQDLSLETEIFEQKLSMPVVIGPVGITGMYARRGEVQMAKAAENKGIPFTQSTVSLCSIEEVASNSKQPIWFQLYVLKDRGFMKDVLERAQALGIKKLVFTVDVPVAGARYRDSHSGMEGSYAALQRILQSMLNPSWTFSVGIMGRPHDMGNLSHYLGKRLELANAAKWIKQNLDPSISWSDLEWIRDFWKGSIIIKGILDPEDAKDAVRFGADGIVVSNHGGRQLDGVLSTAKALPIIANAVGDDLCILADSGIRSGLDIVRMLALGAKAVLLGRAAIYALAAAGQPGVEHLLDILAEEMRIAMTLNGVSKVTQINKANLV